jgi:signal transduction histidine kinase
MNLDLHQILENKSTIGLILDFLPYPFIISDLRGNTRVNAYVNKKFVEEIGYTIEEIPTIDAWFEKAYPDQLYRAAIKSSWYDLVNEAVRNGNESVLMRVLVRTKANGDNWYEVKSSVTSSVQFVAFVNITEVMMKERELQRLNENKNQTLSILAHDVRSPLTSLNSMTRLMLEGNFERHEFLDRLHEINEKSSHVLEFIDTTLHWTRTNFNTMSFKIEDVDVHTTVTKILQVYSTLYQAKNITITKHLNGKVIKTDQEVLTIILRNLLSNAIKFSKDSGEIVVSVLDEADKTLICVKDSGVGMSAETLDKLQNDIYTSTPGTRDEKGLGLGLKLCRQLAKKLNAELKLKSKAGTGTDVTIVFPKSV